MITDMVRGDGEQDQLDEPAPSAPSATAPVEAAADAVPADAVPVEAAPVDGVPVGSAPSDGRDGGWARWITVALLVLTVTQLVVATFVPGLEQFENKGFGARLVLYPAMMLVVPAVWWLRDRGSGTSVPWAAFAWIMLPFLVDVTGNSFDLYDTVWWWDDANHYVNWLFLALGAGLLLERTPRRPAWETLLLVTGLGALMAIGWEIGEYYAFIRFGTELATAYTDTLGDEVLGTLGALTAALVLALRRVRARPSSRLGS